MRGHFQSLQNTISFTIYALLPTLQPQLESAYPVEAISQVLQSKSSGSLGDSSMSSVEPTPEGSVLLQDTPKSPQSEVGLLQAAGESSDHAAVGESWASEFKQGHDHENVDPASPTQASIDGSMLHAPSGDEVGGQAVARWELLTSVGFIHHVPIHLASPDRRIVIICVSAIRSLAFRNASPISSPPTGRSGNYPTRRQEQEGAVAGA